MKKRLICSLAALLLLSTMFFTGCNKGKEIDYDHFKQTVKSSTTGVTAAVNEESRTENYVLVFVAVENETKDTVTVRKGDYTLTANGKEYASDGFLVKIASQSGAAGSQRITTVTYDTVGKGDEKTLSVLFFCDLQDIDNFTIRFHGRVISE